MKINRDRARSTAAAKSQARPPRTCARCGKTFSPTYGDKRRSFCSAGCLKLAFRQGKNHRKRARHHGVSYEPVDPIKVFERDRWRCKLCGERTPKRLRGSLADNAPELDHILPMALGGAHSYANTQCACRKCNIEKGARPLGQMRLFG